MKKDTKKRKTPPNKSPINETKKFFERLPKINSVPPPIQARQIKKKKLPNKPFIKRRIKGLLLDKKRSVKKIFSKPKVKQSKKISKPKKTTLSVF